MKNDKQVYIDLQKHLDRQAVGFPATRTGVEIRILQHIFSPREAEIASLLSYRFEPLETIFKKVRHLVDTPVDLRKILETMQQKGGVEVKSKKNRNHYCIIPLVVGMYEFQLNRLTPDFIKDLDDYTSDLKFGIDFISTELSQMRTIPVAKSISTKHNVSTFDEIDQLLQNAEGPFAIHECICRKKHEMAGDRCRVTDRKETCMSIGDVARMSIENQIGRKIDREEALAVIKQNQKDGLVLQPSNTEKAEFICSCCGCCCGMLSAQKRIPKPAAFWSANYYAVVDRETCKTCGACGRKCQVDAIAAPGKKEPPVINLDRCIGCGVCVANCPTASLSLIKKTDAARPPGDREELYDILMESKKGKLGKLKVAGKFLYDAVSTGQIHLLKPN